MPSVSVNGLEINYREAGSGFPIVLVHGFTGNLRNWALVIPALKDRFRTISVDLRGHGHSGKPGRPEDYTLAAMAEDVWALIQSLGVQKCYLAGHSMGGMVAQHLILDHPEPFRALVLVDTAADMPSGLTGPEQRQAHARLQQIAREQGMEAVFEEQLKANPLAGQLRAMPLVLEAYRQQFLMTSREAYLYCPQGIAKRRPLLEDLSAIRIPTLIVAGRNDEPFLEPSCQMHERIPNSELVIIEGAGHTPQIEKAAEFNRALMNFLDRMHEG